MRALTLNGALYAYSFRAQTYIESLALKKWPPKLLVTWPTFELRDIFGEVVQGFPQEMWLPFWKYRQISVIVHSKSYYCLAMTEYRHQYRLLDFENKRQECAQTMNSHVVFMAENEDNDKQEIRTLAERIELKQPANVMRLYPSLPDIRDGEITQDF